MARTGTRSATARRPRRPRARRPALVFEKILAFSAFGFPKAHSAAFALLAYQSAWLRRHHPAAFLCSLLNAQPMGFYPPASLIRDAQRRGVEVLPRRRRRARARSASSSDGAVRVGLGYVQRPRRAGARAASWRSASSTATSSTAADLAPRRLSLQTECSSGSSPSGACDALRAARGSCCGSSACRPPGRPSAAAIASWRSTSALGTSPVLPEPGAWDQLVADYAHTGLSLREHPIAHSCRR